MKVEYAKRAIADLRSIGAYYATADHPEVGERISVRLREVVARIARFPESGRPVVQRPGVRVVPLRRYPYLVFYRLGSDTVRILHVRQTSRRPWMR
jgi:toxin ParE1/3/4